MTDSIDNFARDLVSREVNLCVSSLVHTLAMSAHTLPHKDHSDTDLFSLACQAEELSYAKYDYEEAAIQSGWIKAPEDVNGGLWYHRDDPEGALTEYVVDTAQDVCEANDLEPYAWDIFEHWAVSRWLGEKLQEAGERVDFDFSGMTVWARTTTGQAIYADHVIQQIARELQGAR